MIQVYIYMKPAAINASSCSDFKRKQRAKAQHDGSAVTPTKIKTAKRSVMRGN